VVKLLYERRNLIQLPALSDHALDEGLNAVGTTPLAIMQAADWRSGARFRVKLFSGLALVNNPADVSIESASLAITDGSSASTPLVLFAKPLQFGALTALIQNMSFESTEIELDYDALLLGGQQRPVLPLQAQIFAVVNAAAGDDTIGLSRLWLDLTYELYAGDQQ
jgi:hypothetical protein